MDRLERTNYKYKILNEISSILKITSGEALAIFNFIEQYADSGIAEVSRIDGVDKYLLSNNMEECINNHIACCYRKEGRCGCTTEDVKRILDHFRIRDIWFL